MRRTGIRATAAIAVSALLLGGCGVKPYDLTEDEENKIVHYSAQVVAKFNAAQQDGLTYVNLDEEQEETETNEKDTKDKETKQKENKQTDAAEAAGGDDAKEQTDETVQQKSLSELFGTKNLTITYTGTQILKNYMEGGYYSLDAADGKVFAIVGIDLKNSAGEDVQLDNLTKAPQFSAVINGENQVKADKTIVSSDFASYAETIAAGETKKAILLFQVPEHVTEVESINLFVNIGGTNYQIAL